MIELRSVAFPPVIDDSGVAAPPLIDDCGVAAPPLIRIGTGAARKGVVRVGSGWDALVAYVFANVFSNFKIWLF